MILKILTGIGIGVGGFFLTRNAFAQYEQGDNYVIPKNDIMKVGSVQYEPVQQADGYFNLNFLTDIQGYLDQYSYDKRTTVYDDVIAATENKYNMPKDLLHRLLYQESRFRQDIIFGGTTSSAGAVGIAQLLPKYHPADGIQRGYWHGGDFDLTDPETSIKYAGAFLNFLYSKYGRGDWGRALAAYNAGERTLLQNGDNLLAYRRETQDYVTEITGDIGYRTNLA